MNVIVTKDAAGATVFVPPSVQISAGNSSISITMVPPSGESWTILGVDSRPPESWSSNTAHLTVGEYAISIDASDSAHSGTSNLLVTQGVKGD